jgi:aromatic ring-opening dioxygenase catalytic subunit (LigB family)
LSAAGLGAGLSACLEGEKTMSEAKTSGVDAEPVVRQPSIFLPHGGGPWTIVDLGPMSAGLDSLRSYLAGLPASLPAPPRAVLCVSAHWEAPRPTVMTALEPPMLYDYSGFPREAYEFKWPAPGSPELASKVVDLLESAGIETGRDPGRGFDHGTFVPLMVSDPRASIPTFQLSLVRGLDPATHIAIGRALAELRAQGVLIVGSGMSYHNMRAFMGASRDPELRRRMVDDSRRFDDWLAELATRSPSEVETRLVEWARAPAARDAHPREEHLVPLMVVAGSAIEGKVTVPYRGTAMGAAISALQFG